MKKNKNKENITIEEVNKSNPKKTRGFKAKRFFLLFISICMIFLSIGIFVLYGPWNFVRDTWITTAMVTDEHQYLARLFYSEETIWKVMGNNQVIEVDEDTNTDIYDFGQSTTTTHYANEYEKQILDRPEGTLYKKIDISGAKYKGYIVAVYDPSKVKLATTKYLGSTGQYITKIAEDNKAVVAINGGGFYDPDWNSNGATPHGTVIKDGKVVWDYEDARMGGGFIGFNYDNELVLGKFTKNAALNTYKLRDAMEFGPFLVVNGKASFIKGNGGWGIAPRTAIGQRADGIVLFLVIDGRTKTSVGADMDDLATIMVNYGAINAANLDGGSSSALIINNKIENKPVAAGQNGLRPIPTAWIVTE